MSSLGLLQYKKDARILEKTHWRVIEMMSGLEHVVYEVKLRSGLFCVEMRRLGR